MKGIYARFVDYKASFATSIFLVLAASDAQAQGLTKAKGFLTSLKENMLAFIPIIAVIAGLILVALYWFDIIRKDSFIKWIVGLIIAGSISEIVALFVT
ncbi:TrbC/VirB2 family protein [Xanthomonas campestris pv. campestris]|uniref:TrbC/VirB2 family protein n=1 Tax=Xanthomonas campestris TaxID=339 RepID=UPI0025A050D9|nr:TrbC/VirB2 family protein [Xanthomonas campestris]MDM7672491.1 TrbC/VirB2 family protein [Xanthomonas campestris pv. campestris]MDM7685216.1 TrbC/VirB2 family protein [Xanthomonas campestris pv. campestris]MDM7693436.1 TrbC/VirB2 family protein [Xanthomonas campestris pv. campestris]MDM7697616.1 TrbC/VirB2 family protein [Xanthomonas campestris pv. campestris]MDM7714825.1 TrbC/VirB2 family protein [Xanthomonas campestris pv. campestris]